MGTFTPWILMWETPDGERHWEAVPDNQMEGFLMKLVEKEHVNPATVMAAHTPIGFHYIRNRFHGDMSDVNFGRINETIYGSTPPEVTNHKPVDVPVTPPKSELKLGWLSPDGRHFPCQYGDHRYTACRIVGDMIQVSDHERYLEDHGWAKIYRDPIEHRTAVGMGLGQTMTEAQYKTINRLDLEELPEVKSLFTSRPKRFSV